MAETEDRGWWPAAWAIAAVLLVAGAGAALYWTWRPANVRGDATRIISLSRLAGKEYHPAIGPDEAVAFLWQQDEARPARIWILAAGEEAPRQLTGAVGEYSSPAWSPDGRWIAALRFRDNSGEIVVLPTGGGAERVLGRVLPTRFGLTHRHLDWSPDGEWLVVDDAEKLRDPLSLFLVSMKTGERRRLTQPDPLAIGDVAPRFSPDGRTLSFIRVANRMTDDLMTVPAQGGTATVIDRSTHLISDQAWSKDGKQLLFSSNHDGEYRIWTIKAAGGNQAPRPTDVYGEFAIQFAVSRKSRALVYTVVQDRINIWRFDLAATADPATRWKRMIGSAGQDRSPQYSPDGQRIAFRSDRSGNEDIWVAAVESDEAVLVTHEHVRPSVPRWRPDGRGLVFNSATTGEIYLADEVESHWAVRRFGAIGEHPVYSPDGHWIYAGSSGGILRYPAQGGAAEKIFDGRGISLGISPNGRNLYFVREPKGTALWRLDLESRELSEVFDGLVPYCGSCWAVTDDGIYYLGTRPEAPNQQALYYREFAKPEAQLVVRYPEAAFPIGIGPFSLSPDERYFLCVRVDSSDSDLLRVEQFQ